MQINICEVCKVHSKLPDGVCVSCAYDNEYQRRATLERHLFQLLDLVRGCVDKVEAAVLMVKQGHNVELSDFAQIMQREPAKMLPAPEEKKEP